MNKTQFIYNMREVRKDSSSTDLQKKVASMLIGQIEGYEKAETMFEDLSHGCISGIVSGLIYYTDTHKFAKKYIEDIMELFATKQEEIGKIEIPTDTDQLNWLAWFGFEETALDFGNSMGLM